MESCQASTNKDKYQDLKMITFQKLEKLRVEKHILTVFIVDLKINNKWNYC